MTIQEAIQQAPFDYFRPMSWPKTGVALYPHEGNLRTTRGRVYALQVADVLDDWEIVDGATIDEEQRANVDRMRGSND
jgi:hypothetical protein